MRFFHELFANRTLWICVIAWTVAQGSKILLTLIVDRRLDLRRMFGLGGMPSSHSAVVCALATCCGITSGFDSASFAISAILAMVVMTDAAGIRRAVGKQARMLNEIVQDMIENGRGLTQETLKELLGHTPLEVLVGAVLGILLARMLI